MKKHIVPIISLVCLIVVIGTLLYSHFEKGGITGDGWGTLLIIFGLNMTCINYWKEFLFPTELHTEYHKNGQKRIEGRTYKNGSKVGKWIEWYESGNKKTEDIYKNGSKDGKCTDWYENGNKIQEINYKNGYIIDKVIINWSPDGKDRSVLIMNDGGIWEGIDIHWYENGNKGFEMSYKDGKPYGKGTQWYENGNKKTEDIFKNGFKDSKSTRWSPDGKDKSEVFYKDHEIWEGIDIHWYENGQKEKEENYDDGELISSKEWNKDGSVKE